MKEAELNQVFISKTRDIVNGPRSQWEFVIEQRIVENF